MAARKIHNPADLSLIKAQAQQPTPVDAPREPELPPFPEIAWRGVFDDYRRAMDGSTEASDVAHFAALWAATAAALGRRIHMYSGDVVYPNAFLAFFGASGDKKTTAQRRLVSCDLLNGQPVQIVENIGSTEGLADSLRMCDGAYLLLWEEFAAFLSQARWTGSTLLEFITETFDCPAHWSRAYRTKPVSLNSPTPTILTATTAEWFWKYAKAEDFFGGFGNRFLFLSGRKKNPIADPREPDPTLLGSVKEQILQLGNIQNWHMEWTPAAEKEWKRFYIQFENRERSGLVGEATRRIHVYVRKLAMSYSAFEAKREIDVEPLRAAIAVGRYAAECASQLIELQAAQRKPQGELEAKFIKWVTAHPGARVRAMQQALQRYCGDSETFNRIKVSLERSDQIEIQERRVYLSTP
jgi:hypothetical protein